MGNNVTQKLTWKEAIAKMRSLLSNLRGSKDAIAVQLYNEGVRKAKCGDSTRCALAQYLINRIGPGYTVSVGGGDIELREDSEDINATRSQGFATRQALSLFIVEFDNKQYSFLQ